MFLSSFNTVLSVSMVSCGTSGLFGGRRVPAERAAPAPLAIFVADNSLMFAFFALAVDLPARGFCAVVLALPTRAFVVFLLVVFLVFILFSPFVFCYKCDIHVAFLA
jgi:hypothetical protein